ncbi:hypothetical protein BKA62DRAFT_662213 [Auriculariales sp. MPI-PUGE-AT-0066]|nr:hypothetical protein BKA62DRAFT_662213 [Auriculariales sp. MPI-PUGE-AT-0066]
MTITSRKPHGSQHVIDEPGLQLECDACLVDLTHSIRIRCAHDDCAPGDGIDICPPCFCKGAQFGKHKRDHPYRVIELHSYPIFDEDWGADEELLLMDGLLNGGLGNWEEAAKHVGTRTKEEIHIHYTKTYVETPTFPLPDMDREFDIDPDEFHARKRRRIEKLNDAPIPKPPPQVVSLPGVHEVAHYLPGRLEFEVEIDNEAEDLIKDLEFGTVYQYNGDDIPEDPNDCDVKARTKWLEERAAAVHQQHAHVNGKTVPGYLNGSGFQDIKSESSTPAPQVGTPAPADTKNNDEEEEQTDPPPFETPDSVAFKLTLIDMYSDRVRKRKESKAFVLDRGLLDVKRFKDKEKEIPYKEFVSKFKPFARLQTADDYEFFINGLQYELMLRKRLQNLQDWRRLGLTSWQDVEKYDRERALRTQKQAVDRGYLPVDAASKKDAMSLLRESVEPSNGAPKRKPLTLATAPSFHLLHHSEQTLCHQLKMLPRAYLVVKETLVREFARRGGRLRKREAKDIIRIDPSKTNRIWDYLVMSGTLKVDVVNDPSGSGAGGGSSSGGSLPDPSSGSHRLINGQHLPPPMGSGLFIAGALTSAATPADTQSTTSTSSQPDEISRPTNGASQTTSTTASSSQQRYPALTAVPTAGPSTAAMSSLPPPPPPPPPGPSTVNPPQPAMQPPPLPRTPVGPDIAVNGQANGLTPHGHPHPFISQFQFVPMPSL